MPRPHLHGSAGAPERDQSPEPVPFAATSLAAGYDAIAVLPVSVLLDNVRSLYNVGAFFRTAEAARVERLYLSGVTAAPPHKGIAKTALGAESRVAWERVADPIGAVASLRARGYQIVAIETSLRAADLFDWRPAFPVCVLFGHEIGGLPAELLDACDVHVRIPMLGRKQSLNVATAGGVVLYELLRKFRQLLAEGETLRARPTAESQQPGAGE